MAIIVSAPDAFFDAEPWAFDLVISAADGAGPLNLTGSRLYAAFLSLSDNVVVGACSETLMIKVRPGAGTGDAIGGADTDPVLGVGVVVLSSPYQAVRFRRGAANLWIRL